MNLDIKYLISYSSFNNNISNPNLYSIFEIIQKDESFAVRYMNTPIMRDANVIRKKSLYSINTEFIRYDAEKIF